jgi:hypothetical protein
MDKDVAEVRALLEKAENSTLPIVASRIPVNRDRAEEAVRISYQEGGLRAPDAFRWFPSPWECGTFLSTETALESLVDLTGRIWTFPRARAWTAIEKHFDREKHSCPWRTLADGPAGKLRSALKELNRGVETRCGYGNHDAPWLAQLRALKFEMGVKGIPRFEGLNRLVEHGCWFLPFEKLCLMVDRPSEVHYDREGRLHRVDGPAVVWGCYARFYRIRGVAIPSRAVLDPQSVSVEWINRTAHWEMREALIELYGWERYLEDAGARIIHQDECGILYEFRMNGDAMQRVVQFWDACPEGDDFQKRCFRFVPLENPTVQAAMGWIPAETDV